MLDDHTNLAVTPERELDARPNPFNRWCDKSTVSVSPLWIGALKLASLGRRDAIIILRERWPK